MNTSGSNPQVETLLKQGIDAARGGDKAAARALLEQVVEQDQQNEKGWFWLAAVTEDLNEKRICLGNVLVINPNNQRARKLLEQLESPNTASTSFGGMSQSSGGGTNRTTLFVAIGLGGIAITALLILLLLMMGGDDKEKEPAAQPTAAIVLNTPQPVDGATPVAGQPETLVMPTLAPTATITPPPATWTPVPSNTPIPALPPTVFPAPPVSVSGVIIMRSGDVPGDLLNQPIVLLKADGTDQRTVSQVNERGHSPGLSPDSSQFVFVLYAPGTREHLLSLNNLQGTAPRPVSRYWANTPTLQKQDAPSWSPDGKWLTFTAQGMGSPTVDLYRVSLNTPEGDPAALERLTSDDAIESWPSFSPDGLWIVYSADLSKLDFNAASELRIYDTISKRVTNLTTNGAELIETAPDWSPDGKTIVFQALSAGSPQNDIYLISADGTTAPQKIIDSGADDIAPRFSPDGLHIVFSSDAAGNWDVYIYEIATQTIYQITTSPDTDIANDWGRES
ncbi:MAG: PD40 domain-containing protein [Chloroflexi bacterium]|nr:PD40 domain-containing protein [Chloroflexota bacterium]